MEYGGDFAGRTRLPASFVLQPALSQGVAHNIGAGRKFEFFHQAGFVAFDGFYTDMQAFADFFVGIARVGYDNSSHFNRDYKRFFGEPPLRDVERLREMTVVSADV
jgi:hypothetical protein